MPYSREVNINLLKFMSVSTTENEQPKAVLRKARIICNIFDTEYDVVKQVISETLGWRITENEDDDWDITWTDNAVPSEKLSKMRIYQKINHFPGMHGICKKNYLAWNLNKMLKIYPNEYNFYPRTWVLPGDYADFKSQLNNKKIFIVKPEASSQGRGIFLIKKLKEINISERYVVQEYLTNPLLIENLKFDLRIYVLVTGCNPLRVYIHEDGLTRLATESYTGANSHNFADMCMHLTNYAINKTNPKFQFNSDPNQDCIGHKRSLNSTYEYLQGKGINIIELKLKIEDIILKTLCSVQPSLAHVYRTCQPEDVTNSMCFELLGFDIIIDNAYNPILLEVNHSPSFSTDSPLDWKIKHRLIKESLQMLGARVRDRKNYYAAKKTDGQRRTLSCKSSKDSREERAEKTKESFEKRNKWEDNHLGGFKKIYPAENKEKYDLYLNSAAQMWADISGHFPKKKIEESPPKTVSVMKAASKPKPIVSIPKRALTLSSTSLQKTESEYQSPAIVPDDIGELDSEIIKRMMKDHKISLNVYEMRELLTYKQLEELLKERRHAISLMRGSEYSANVMKLIKPDKRFKDSLQGNFLVPKTFDFSPKVVQPTTRTNNEYKSIRNIKEINNITI